ncbi:hypothetical protein OS580_001465 [Escherichia coli]|nr:hypothetical protein [Escherichia coli]
MSIIDLNLADIFNAIGGGSPLSIIDSALHPQYVIRYARDDKQAEIKADDVALEFSGMASIQPGGSAQITTAPTEHGQYHTLNKVRAPMRVRCAILISGLTGYSGDIPDIFDITFTSQSETLKKIREMLSKPRTYNIETPKETFSGFDLVEHSYEVNSQRGVTLLTVYLEFQEVIDLMDVALSGAQSKEKPTNDGKSNGSTGTGGNPVNQGGTDPCTLDKLKASLASLKKSLGETGEGIQKGFKSALETIGKPAGEALASGTQKVADLVAEINKDLL